MPPDRGGVALSGHTDVVPVDGQNWDTDPYEINHKDDRLYGRGTCDMKSFIAVCLAKVPQIIGENLETPIHFAFSYDEEIGCVGVQTLLRELEQRPNKPRLCVIGEPTGMRVVRAHKGKISKRLYDPRSGSPFGSGAYRCQCCRGLQLKSSLS